MIFLDIDKSQLPYHFMLHDAWYRKSSTKGWHVILNDAICHDCYSDTNYDGYFLYNNKGDHWADLYWRHTKTGKYTTFPSSIVIHFVFEQNQFISDKLDHYITDFNPKIQYIKYPFFKHAIYDKTFYGCYTFHSVLWSKEPHLKECNSTISAYWFTQDFNDLKESIQLKDYTNHAQVLQDYQSFLKVEQATKFIQNEKFVKSSVYQVKEVPIIL